MRQVTLMHFFSPQCESSRSIVHFFFSAGAVRKRILANTDLDVPENILS